MRRNVEIKARLRDPDRVAEAARRISGTGGETLVQADTFFRVPSGRLKLRELGRGGGELIWYDRRDRSGPTPSRYVVVATDDPAGLGTALEAALGRRGIVRKTRRLFRVGRTRIHLDDVEGLGAFLELEVVLGEGEQEERGRAEARELLDRLGIRASDLVEPAYIDLLERAHESRPGGNGHERSGA